MKILSLLIVVYLAFFSSSASAAFAIANGIYDTQPEALAACKAGGVSSSMYCGTTGLANPSQPLEGGRYAICQWGDPYGYCYSGYYYWRAGGTCEDGVDGATGQCRAPTCTTDTIPGGSFFATMTRSRASGGVANVNSSAYTCDGSFDLLDGNTSRSTSAECQGVGQAFVTAEPAGYPTPRWLCWF